MKPASQRPQLTRLPFRALGAVAKVIESGDQKYAEGDWINAPDRINGRRDLDSALSHIAEWLGGKNFDEESGESPLAHSAARLLFILERQERGRHPGDWRIDTSLVVRNSKVSPPPGIRFCPAFRDRGGRPFGCCYDEGHEGPHSFTVMPPEMGGEQEVCAEP